MMIRPQKHSLSIRGHRTSVSLEPEFWEAFKALAKARGTALNEFAAQIDETRGPDIGLASAIRLTVLNDLKTRLEAHESD